MSWESKFFISTMVFKEAQTYYKAFENELNRHIKKDFSILLPTKEDETPDFAYMENYIKELETRERERASFLFQIIWNN